MAKKGLRGISYTHLMRWEPLEIKGAQGRAWIKSLAIDDETGARTCVVRYDPGFKLPAGVTEAPVDSYVMEGSMRVGDQKWQPGTFNYRPAGAEHGPIETDEGITRLVFREDPAKSSKEPLFIQDSRKIGWTANYDDPTGTGRDRGVKNLRVDKVGGYKVFLICHFVTGWRAVPNKGHLHDHIEEAFLLEGEMQDYLQELEGHVTWVPGFYVCREPYISGHGDVTVTKGPVLMFARREWIGSERDLRSADWKHFDVPGAVNFSPE